MPSSSPPPFTPTTERGRQRRDALLDVAQRLFLERGYAQVGVNDIVADAGGSLTTLYRHFGSKEGLFQAVIEQRSRRIRETLTAEDIDELPLETALSRLGHSLMHKVMDESTLSLYREVVAECPRQPELARLFFDAGPGRVRAALAAYFQRRMARGAMPVRDSDELAGLFLGMLLGEWQMLRLLQIEPLPSNETLERRVERCIELFLQGVNAPS